MGKTGIDYKVVLIFLVAISVDVFLIISAKSKLVKSMWSCFGAFMVSMLSLKLLWQPLYSNSNLHVWIYILMAITAGSFIAGVVLAYINSMTGAE